MWISIIAFIGVTSGILVLKSCGYDKAVLISIIAGIIALAICFWPLLSVAELARENKVPLSLGRYFSAITAGNDDYVNTKFTTYTFAGSPGADLKLDVYRPTMSSKNNGASVVVVHGGSWSGGVRNDFPQWNARLAKMGFTVFDVDYRLAPQPNYLTATGDVKCAVRWIRENANEFGIDPERIALLGRSAGAHLALLAAYSADDVRIPSACATPQSSEKVSAVISLYAPIDLLWAFDNPANQRVIDGPETLTKFLGGSPHESHEIRDRFLLASPTTHVSTSTPPTLLIHGGSDQLVRSENMRFLSEKLTETHIANRTILIPYAQHGFDYNLNGWGSQITEAAILSFLAEHIK